MDPRNYPNRLTNTVAHFERLKAKMTECEDLIRTIDPLTDTARLLNETKRLTAGIDQMCQDAVKALEDDWLFVTKDLQHRINEQFRALESGVEIENAKLREILGLTKKPDVNLGLLELGDFKGVGKSVTDLVLTCATVFYRLAGLSHNIVN